MARETLDPRWISDAMRPKSAGERSDRALARAAAAQHGILTLAQLQQAGLSPRAISHRATAGRLTRLHAGIYAVDRPSRAGHWMAGVLACGANAVLSHRTAAALWGVAEVSASIEVTIASDHGRKRTGLVVYRCSTLDASDIASLDGLPCTSLARTLLDLAAVVDPRALERAIDRAETLRVFDLDALHELLRRNRRSRGARALAAALDSYAEPAISRSEAEERLLALVDGADLSRPRVNAWIGLPDGSGYEADFLWPDAQLVVEVDGRAYHARRRAFEHDRRRDRALALAGFETRRYAAGELTANPKRVIAELREFLIRGGFRP